MLNKLPVVFVDKDDTVGLITVEIAVEDGEDTAMIKVICNIIVLQTDISNFMSYIYSWQWLVNKTTKYII